MEAYGGGGALGAVPVRSRRAALPAPALYGGGGGGDPVLGVGELSEVVDGGADATRIAEASHRLSARCGYGRPTPLQRYALIAMAGRDLMASAQTGSGKAAAFCFFLVSGPVAAAAPGGWRRYGPRDPGSLDRPAELRALVFTGSREHAAQIREVAKKFPFKLELLVEYEGIPMQNQCDLERGVCMLIATPGRTVKMIERSGISLEAIKYLVMDKLNRMINMGVQPQIRMTVNMMNMSKKLVRQTFILTGTRPPQIQMKDLVLNIIEGIPEYDSAVTQTEIRIKLLRQKVLAHDTLEKIGSIVTDNLLESNHPELSENLTCEKLEVGEISGTKPPEKKSSLHRPHISSSKFWPRVYLFIVILASLVSRSSQIPVSDNASGICLAPYLHEPYLQFKRPVPAYRARLFEKLDPGCQSLFKQNNECPNQSSDVQAVSKAGGIISLLANFAPLLLALNIGGVDPRRVLLVGSSTLFHTEANLLWYQYLIHEKCANNLSVLLAIIASAWNLCYAVRFWFGTSLGVKHTTTILLLCIILAITGYISSTAAGIFALILTSGGHIARILSVYLYARDFNMVIFILSFCGAASGCVLYNLDFNIMTLFKIGSLVSFGARVIDMVLQLVFFCCKDENNDTTNETNLSSPLLLPDAVDGQVRVLQLDTIVVNKETDDITVDEESRLSLNHAIEENETNGQVILPSGNEKNDKGNGEPVVAVDTDSSLGNGQFKTTSASKKKPELNSEKNKFLLTSNQPTGPANGHDQVLSDTNASLNHAAQEDKTNGHMILPSGNEKNDKANGEPVMVVHTDSSLGNVFKITSASKKKPELDSEKNKLLLTHSNQFTGPANGHHQVLSDTNASLGNGQPMTTAPTTKTSGGM